MPSMSQRTSQLLAARKRVERAVLGATRSSFERGRALMVPFAESLHKASTPVFPPDWDKWEDEFDAALEEALLNGLGRIGQVDARIWRAYATGRNYDPDAIARALRQQVAEHIKGIKATTKDKVRDAVQAWHADPAMSQADLATRLESWFSPARANTIAVTETTSLVSGVTAETMKQLDLKEWTWQSRREWNTCDPCKELHGQTFKLGDPMPPDGSHIGCYCVPAPKLN